MKGAVVSTYGLSPIKGRLMCVTGPLVFLRTGQQRWARPRLQAVATFIQNIRCAQEGAGELGISAAGAWPWLGTDAAAIQVSGRRPRGSIGFPQVHALRGNTGDKTLKAGTLRSSCSCMRLS